METGSASGSSSLLSEKAEALKKEDKIHCDLNTGHVNNITPKKTNDYNELSWDSEENVEQNKDIRSTAGNNTELNKDSDTESPWDSYESDDENKSQPKVVDVLKSYGKSREESDVKSAWDSDENDNDEPQYEGKALQNEESNNEENDAESAWDSDGSEKEPNNVENDLGNTKNVKTKENEAEIIKTEADSSTDVGVMAPETILTFFPTYFENL